jgi:hypothetical protein
LPNLSGVELPLWRWAMHDHDDGETASNSSASSAQTVLRSRVRAGWVRAMVTWLAPALTSIVASLRAVSGVWSPMSATAGSLVSCRLAAKNPRSARDVAAARWPPLGPGLVLLPHGPSTSLAPPGMAPKVRTTGYLRVASDLSPAGWSGRSTILLSDRLGSDKKNAHRSR